MISTLAGVASATAFPPASLVTPSIPSHPSGTLAAGSTRVNPVPPLATGEIPASLSLAATPEPRRPGKYWSEWPLIPPDVSGRMIAVYKQGIALGNNPHAFSTIGDCQSAPAIFMGVYDTDRYELGDYQYLEETIHQFEGSFGRQSITVQDGQSVASVLSPAWADPDLCDSGETPIDCEIRLHKPSILFINLGTNWQGGNDVTHTEYLKKIVDIALEHGVVPILSSKGDNLEGDYRLNRATAQVAYEYELPFWNFWRAIRNLPGKGLDGSKPGQYLSVDAWGRRSFTGLQALDAVWRSLSPYSGQ
ncbi:MAG: hypothetical protein GYA17_10900 [Chloroflexi bacterium]|nr:hypothetical protein [Chloroflexota bacterium]